MITRFTIIGLALAALLSGCATGTLARRGRAQSALADAERDIGSGKVRFAYVGGFGPVAPGLPLTASAHAIRRRYPALKVGLQDCLQDAAASEENHEYARRYNTRMWSYVLSHQ